MIDSTKDKKEMLQDSFGLWASDYSPQENEHGLVEFSENPCLLEYTAQESYSTIVAEKEDDSKTLELLFQTIIEHCNEMTPLLNLLREKSEEDKGIAKLLEDIESRIDLQSKSVSALAPRELEVLELVVQGKSNREIAEMLGIKMITVGKTLTRVYRKLNAKNRSDAVFKWTTMQNIE